MHTYKQTNSLSRYNITAIQGGDSEDGEGGGSDIGALLGNLGPLIGGLSGVSCYSYDIRLYLFANM
jgi:hypothetical protein